MYRYQAVGGIQRLIAVVCLVLFLPGCTGWQNLPITDPLPPLVEQAESLRLTLRDGRELELRHTRVVGDSVIGQSAPWSLPMRVSVAVGDIRTLAGRPADSGNFAGAIFGLVAVATIAMLVMGHDAGCALGCP